MLAGFGIMELQRVLASLHNAVITPEANDVIAMEDKVSGLAWYCSSSFAFVPLRHHRFGCQWMLYLSFK